MQFDLGKLQPGMQVTVEWRSKPVFILRRTEDMLQQLNQPEHLLNLRDPNSGVESQEPAFAVNAVRSLQDEYFIVNVIKIGVNEKVQGHFSGIDLLGSNCLNNSSGI